ncbi:MAG: MarC family protein [Methanomassiliicoccales archaeon]
MGVDFAVSAFVTIFALINPVAAVPFFEAVTEGYPPEIKKRIVKKIFMVTVITLFIFGLFGHWIFSIYGITIPVFKVAGGALVFYIGFSMVQGQWTRTKLSTEDREEALESDEIGIVPLGIPMFAGPGSITMVMILISESINKGDLIGMGSVFLSVLITMTVTYFLLTHSSKISELMGRATAVAFTRIMGLLITAVGVSFISTGIITIAQTAAL